MTTDKAGKSYWDHTWDNKPLPRAIDPRAQGLNHYVDLKFHDFFRKTFSELETKDKKILEIGCARSQWLPYFVKEFGFKVCGLDYSEGGCEQARWILSEEGVEGQVVCCDLFCPPQSMLAAFDVVVSLGVVEHFENTEKCLKAVSAFLKPGGLAITSIPNMVGIAGSILKITNRRVFDAHVPLDDRALAASHGASLDVLSCRYFLFVNWGVIDLEKWKGRMSYRLGVRLRSWMSKGFWILDDFFPIFRPNRLTSPYVNCVSRKPCA